MSQSPSQDTQQSGGVGPNANPTVPVVDKKQLDTWSMSIDVNPDTLRASNGVALTNQTGVTTTHNGVTPVALDNVSPVVRGPSDGKTEKKPDDAPSQSVQSTARPSMEEQEDTAERSSKKRTNTEMTSGESGKQMQPMPIPKDAVRELLMAATPNYDAVAVLLVNAGPLDAIGLLASLYAENLPPQVAAKHFGILKSMLEKVNPKLAKICDFDHRVNLGRDPDQPNYDPRPEEIDTGLRIELLLDTQLTRHKELAATKAGTPVKGDWVDGGGVIYDGCSPPGATLDYTFKPFQSKKAYDKALTEGWELVTQEGQKYTMRKSKNSFDIFLQRESKGGAYATSLKEHLETVGGPPEGPKSFVVIDVMGRELDPSRIQAFLVIVNKVIVAFKDAPRAGVLLVIDGRALHFAPGDQVRF